MNKYKQLSYEQRCHIYILKKSQLSQRKIASLTGVNQSTISRELSRNSGGLGYLQNQAQTKCDYRRKSAVKAVKMTRESINLIETQLREQWSPEQVSGWLAKTHSINISHERIYLHVWADKQAGGNLYTHLRRQGKKYVKRGSSKRSRGQIKDRVSIEERPDIVDERSRIGDWEIDTVIGKGHSGAIVTIVERKTKFTVAAQVNSKHANAVTLATIKLLKPYKSAVLTITADNGKEFANHKEITKALGAPVYFCHPYRSCERGLNENTNGLLRQYWPKCTDFKKVKQRDVVKIVTKLNQRPRKILQYDTPADLMSEHIKMLAA